jgi:hypothetical protein
MLLASAALVCLAGNVSAQDGAALKAALDAEIAKLTAAGGSLTWASEDVSAGGLTLNGVVYTAPANALVLESATLSLAASNETPGNVVVTTAPTMALTVTPDGDAAMAYTMNIVSDGLRLVTNWPAGAAAPKGTVSANSLQIVGTRTDHPVLKNLDITQGGMVASFALDEAAGTFSVSTEADTVSAAYTVDMSATGGGAQDMNFSSDGLSVQFTGTGFRTNDEREFEQFIADGGSFTGAMNIGATTFASNSTDPNMPLSMTGTGGASTGTLSIDKAGFSYRTDFDGAQYNIVAQGAPFPPVAVSMGKGLMDIAMPLSPGDAPAPARLGFELTGVTVGEELWAMIDPGQTIPRDPALIRILLNGMVQMNAPLVPSADGAPPSNPMETMLPQSLNVESVSLSVGGASIDATGALTFDNSAGMPMPAGAIDIGAKGIKTLADRVAALGLVDPMQVTAAVGMILGFTTPGAEPDSYTTKIEFKDGGVTANGIPLPM